MDQTVSSQKSVPTQGRGDEGQIREFSPDRVEMGVGWEEGWLI